MSNSLDHRNLQPLLLDDSDVDNSNCVHCQALKLIVYQKECGCRVCADCLDGVLDAHMSCPGSSAECSTLFLQRDADGELPEDLFLDNAAKRFLLSRVIKCPYWEFGCTHSSTVREVIQHLTQGCPSQPVQCPLCLMEVDKDSLEKHQSEDCVHRLVTCAYCAVSMTFQQLDADHYDYASDPDNCCEAFDKYTCINCGMGVFQKAAILYHMSNECQLKDAKCMLQEHGCTFREKGRELQLHRDKDKDAHLKLLKSKETKLTELLTKTKRDFGQLAHQFNNQVKRFCDNQREKAILDVLQQTSKQLKEEPDESGSLIKDNFTQLSADMDWLMDSWNRSGEMLWKLDEFTKKRQSAKSFDSQTFYSSLCGYRLRVRCYPNGNGKAMGLYLSLYFALLSGNCDDLLEWPMKQNVTLEIIHATRPQNSKRQTYCMGSDLDPFRKPVADRSNTAVGNPRFLSLNELPAYLINDCLFIRCKVEIQ